jgi:DNA-binding MarR family transcriptional regulator
MYGPPVTRAGPQGERDGRTRALGVELVRLRRATEALRARITSGAGIDLEPAAASVLFMVVRLGPQRASELARALWLDPSTMSRHVSALLRKGYVRRVPCPEDGRAALIEATDVGLDAHDRVVAHRHRILTSLLQSWDEADITALASLLTRLNDTVEASDLHDVLSGWPGGASRGASASATQPVGSFPNAAADGRR